jgi:enoyl-CoA hydratase/carnithine racemase
MTDTGAIGGPVSVEHEGTVAIVRIDRPPHNLLTEPTLRAVADALSGLAPATVAVLTTSGRTFCAGADFRAEDAPDPTDGEGFEARTGAFYRQAVRVFGSPVPVVAAIQGPAIGAGFGLALACDLRVVGSRAWFQANFVRLGIHPGFALSLTLPRTVGEARAADLLLTGRRIEADEATAIGIAHQQAEAGAELDVALDVARQLADAAPLALTSTRATLRRGLVEAAADMLRHELAEQTELAGTADAVEGVQAMLQGRAPRFTGR